MEITDARVARIHYTLTDASGNLIDKSPEASPLAYFHGAGNIVPGLEKALAGKQPGDNFKVEVAPEEGYGIHRDELVQVVPRSAFQGVDTLEPGMQFRAQGANGNGPVPQIALTLIGVQSLFTPDMLIEIEAVAVVD